MDDEKRARRFGRDWIDARDSGGRTTIEASASSQPSAFDTAISSMDADTQALHDRGKRGFEGHFVQGPNPDQPRFDGLGPVFNQDSCRSCHASDARSTQQLGAINAPDGQWTRLSKDTGILLRLSLKSPDRDPDAGADCARDDAGCGCAQRPVPGFGGQLMHRSVSGFRPESESSGMADVDVRFHSRTVTLSDGRQVRLRKPEFRVSNPWDRPGEFPSDANDPAPRVPGSRLLQADVQMSPRSGVPTIGLGLLEAIPEDAILALADPDDADGDGISGRPNWVCDIGRQHRREEKVMALGRFGWKASQASVLSQVARAYQQDMGITSYLLPKESIEGISALDRYRVSHPQDDGQAATGFELSETGLTGSAVHSSTLAVPARADVGDEQVRKGAEVFAAIGCAACHQPSFTTGPHPGIPSPAGIVKLPMLSDQRIHPYTDLLLHDMGEELADHRPDYNASGREWKTRPLWGLGLRTRMNKDAGLLHDARAATIEEAILWHGGEAEGARESFRTVDGDLREALLRFLRSL